MPRKGAERRAPRYTGSPRNVEPDASDLDDDLAEVLAGLEVFERLDRLVEVERPVDDGLELVDRDGLHEGIEVLPRTDEYAPHHRELRHQRIGAQIALGPRHDADDADEALAPDREVRLRQRAHAARVDDVLD